jgi:hypothetical protein
MEWKALRKLLAAAFVTCLLSTAVVRAEDGARTVRTKAQPAARQQTATKTTTFKSERTDSWLCTYVSPLFCPNLIPTLSTSSSGATASSSVPDRSRRD